MGQARMHAPPSHFHGAFPGNPSPSEFRPFPPGNQPNRMPFHFMPPQQNPFPNANRQGGNPGGPNPIYDPFAPTSVPGGSKETTG
jgi:splicing factor 1